MEDFAFSQLYSDTESLKYVFAKGPFISKEKLNGEEECAIYRNNFSLSDPMPWKIPKEFYLLNNLNDLFLFQDKDKLPEISWNGLDDYNIREIFDEILQLINESKIEKIVPVLAEFGELKKGNIITLIKSLSSYKKSIFGYGYKCDSKGMIGVSPEILFNIKGNVMKTMALAGTSPKHEKDEFACNVKEIEEHEIVSNYIENLINSYGEVFRSNREIIKIGYLLHFITNFKVKLKSNSYCINDIIKRLHPTPALGVHPNTDTNFNRLLNYRKQLLIPNEFGAPFGVFYKGEVNLIVAIRSLFWEENKVCLPSGIGIVKNSRFDKEWRELSMKRNFVKSLLSV